MLVELVDRQTLAFQAGEALDAVAGNEPVLLPVILHLTDMHERLVM